MRDSSVLCDTCEILSGFFEIDSDRGDISRDSSVLIEICEILSGFFQVSFEILAIFLINKRAGTLKRGAQLKSRAVVDDDDYQ